MNKEVLTSNLLLQDVDLTLQTSNLHLLVSVERALACWMLQCLYCLSGLCSRSGQRLLHHLLRVKLRHGCK